MTFLVIGVDAATWRIINPNIDQLPTFKKILSICDHDTIHLKEKPFSPPLWCGMFCGKSAEEHGHKDFVVDGEIQTREMIKVDFIWDVLDKKGVNVKAFNIPFVVPPYNFNVKFDSIGFGLPDNPTEWEEELEKVTEKTIELMNEKTEVIITTFTSLDRVQHFHWGEPVVLEWYKKLDSKLNKILFGGNFINDEKNKLIIISDHGFCSFGESNVQTLPQKTSTGREIKGDHHEDAIIITKNIDYKIEKPQDVFFALEKEFL